MNLCCVKCTSILDKARIEDIEIDLCPQCGGLWLDHGEIERLGRKGDREIAGLRGQLQPAGTEAAPPSDTKVPCPACPGKLTEIGLGPILIDFCPRCKGLFLDRGELDQALALLKDKKTTVAALVGLAAQAARTSAPA